MRHSVRNIAEAIVRDVIYAWKPFPWAPNSPADPEFDGEVRAIVRQLGRIKTSYDAATVIARVFHSSFGDQRFTPESCAHVGEQLHVKLAAAGLIT
jgi:hypothetical protein